MPQKFQTGDEIVIAKQLRYVQPTERPAIGTAGVVVRYSLHNDSNVWITFTHNGVKKTYCVRESDIEFASVNAQAVQCLNEPATNDKAGRCPFENGYLVTVKVEGHGEKEFEFFCPPSYAVGEYKTDYLYVKVLDNNVFAVRRARAKRARPAVSPDFARTVYGRLPHKALPSSRSITVTSQPDEVPSNFIYRGEDPPNQYAETTISGDQTLQLKTPEGPTDMAHSYPNLEIKHLTLLNGNDVKSLSDAQIADFFVNLDKAIKDIEVMERPLPKRLLNRLNKLKTDRRQLIEVLDKEEPEPAAEPAAE